jgi:hypothetical protein
MPTYNSDLAANQVSGLLANRNRDGGRESGNIRAAWAVYTTTGAEVNNDVIRITMLPIGAVVTSIRITSEALGGTGTAISGIGDAVSASRYSATSVSLVTAATTVGTLVPATFTAQPFKVTAATQMLTANFALSSGSVTAGRNVAFLIEYTVLS